MATSRPVGELLREWRERRRLSQLELSIQADVSTRHLSFVETGRSRPTPEMIVKLTEHLEVPLRERNQLLLAGGYAPRYPEHGLDAPELAQVREALRLVLAGHEPYPALVINRWWELLDANAAVPLITAGCAPHLLEPPVNVLRLSLHPDGMAPRIRNLPQWRAHVLHRLAREVRLSGDPGLAALHAELSRLPGGLDPLPPDGIAVPLRIRVGDDDLAFLSTVTTFGTAVDLTAAELSLEAFLPADERTADAVRARAQPPAVGSSSP
jgi:transcriptional regulator with XRE-family HTH domain